MPARRQRTRSCASWSPRPAPALLDLHGIGPSGAARLLVEVGDITRFPDRGHFASWNGTAPIDASSGDHVRHRLSRAGNRQINRTLHIMATVQLRNPGHRPRLLRPPQGRREVLDGSDALPETTTLRHRLPTRLLDDAVARRVTTSGTGPGGQRGNDSDSSAAGSQPHTELFGQASPEPVNHQA